MSNILVIAESQAGTIKKSGCEAVTQARKIADASAGQVTALLLGNNVSAVAASLGEYGADKILVTDDPKLENYQAEIFKTAVVQAAEKLTPDVILFSATLSGKDLSPRVAAALDAALASDCTGLKMENGHIELTRPLYAGKVFASIIVEGSPVIVSLRPNVFDAEKCRRGFEPILENLSLPIVGQQVELVEVKKSSGDKLDVAEAEIIVTGGRGMRDAASFSLVENLATTLNAAVGATRAVVDAGWRPHDEQVGQTGKVVSPNLYLICGASGSIQHWAGMSGSRCIVAINKDAAAPIISRADYSIIGDVFEVLPVLNDEIKKVRG